MTRPRLHFMRRIMQAVMGKTGATVRDSGARQNRGVDVEVTEPPDNPDASDDERVSALIDTLAGIMQDTPAGDWEAADEGSAKMMECLSGIRDIVCKTGERAAWDRGRKALHAVAAALPSDEARRALVAGLPPRPGRTTRPN